MTDSYYLKVRTLSGCVGPVPARQLPARPATGRRSNRLAWVSLRGVSLYCSDHGFGRDHSHVGDRFGLHRARTVRTSPGDLRGLHRFRPVAVVHRGLPARGRSAALRQHPHRVVGDRTPDDAVPGRSPGDDSILRERNRRPRGGVRRIRCHRCHRPPRLRSRSPDPLQARLAVPPHRPHPGLRAAGRVHRTIRASLERAARGGSRSPTWCASKRTPMVISTLPNSNRPSRSTEIDR